MKAACSEIIPLNISIYFIIFHTRDRPIWVRPIPIYVLGRYFCRYRYRYICTNISATDTDTDIFIWPIYGRYLLFWPIYWPISMIFNRYLADTNITDIYMADTDTDMADTDIPFADTDISVSVSVSAKYIGKPIYRSIPNQQTLTNF